MKIEFKVRNLKSGTWAECYIDGKLQFPVIQRCDAKQARHDIKELFAPEIAAANASK